jgi:hypothetical protein
MTRRDALTLVITAVAGAEPASQRLAVVRCGDIPVKPLSSQTFFIDQDDFIHGTVPTSARSGSIQLLKRTGNGPWIAFPSIANKYMLDSPGITGWTVPIHLSSQDEPETVIAVLVDQALPPGLIMSSPRWSQVRLQSEPVRVSCASFTRARLRVAEIGGRTVLPNVPMPVANCEEVKIIAEGVPRGALIQAICQPTDNSRRWPSDHVELAYDSHLTTTVYFGRVAAGRERETLDLHSKFWLYAAATSLALPVRPSLGVDATEWLGLSRYVKALSPKVDAVRAILPGEIRVRITRLGNSNDGAQWLAMPVSRVEGVFSADRTYIPISHEIITLLCRAPDSKAWRVAAASYLGKNRAYFVLPAADLGTATGGRSGVAMAAVSFTPFDPSRPVTEEDLRARQIAISDEVVYRLIDVRR